MFEFLKKPRMTGAYVPPMRNPVPMPPIKPPRGTGRHDDLIRTVNSGKLPSLDKGDMMNTIAVLKGIERDIGYIIGQLERFTNKP